MKILVTGANGWVGQSLCSFLEESGEQLVRAVRKARTPLEVEVGEVNASTHWDHLLESGIQAVVHLAAQLPMPDDRNQTNAAEYRAVNSLGTAHLARRCAVMGVKRFIFVSSAKVLGEGRDSPYQDKDLAEPSDAYALSKWEAEQALQKIAAETAMEIVILRPPLIYGPGVKGNFLRLMQAVDRTYPLPFGSIQNLRSLIYLGNFVDAIDLCLKHPAAAGKIFMVSDGEDVSTPELIRRIAFAMGRRAFIVPVKVAYLKWVASLFRKQSAINRLVGSLSVDITPMKEHLGWNPPYRMQSGLAATAQWYGKIGKDS